MPKRDDRIRNLINAQRTLIICSSDRTGKPLASYAPYLWEDGAFFVFVSGLAAHTENLSTSSGASIMVIEDEGPCKEIFARCRVIFDCSVSVVPATDPAYTATLNAMHERLGETIGMIRNLPDFLLFRLKPMRGNYVEGFGKAYVINDPTQLSGQHRTTD